MVDFIPTRGPPYDDPAKVKALTRSVLWKLDIHILPPLAFVRANLEMTNKLLDSVIL